MSSKRRERKKEKPKSDRHESSRSSSDSKRRKRKHADEYMKEDPKDQPKKQKQETVSEKEKKLQEMLAAAKKTFQAKAQAAQVPIQSGSSQSAVQTQNPVALAAIAAAKQLAAQQTNQFQTQQNTIEMMPKGFVPPPLRLDTLGREIDDEGRIISRGGPVSNLKVNIKKAREQKLKDFEKVMAESEKDSETLYNSEFFDKRSKAKYVGERRDRKKAFQFIEPGSWARRAEHGRAKAMVEELTASDEKMKEARKKLGGLVDQADPALSLLAATMKPKKNRVRRAVPAVEWWDTLFLPQESYDSLPSLEDQDDSTDTFLQDTKLASQEDEWDGLLSTKVTHYIEHPLETAPPPEKKIGPLPTFLTKRERKKLRHRNRLERQKEKQDMIRLGLVQPPKPKAKMESFMRVLGNEAIQDPTQIEKAVRDQVDQRQQEHIQRNEKNRLTKEQKRDKLIRKMTEDTTNNVHVAIFRVDHLFHPRHIFKVDTEARQYKLTGTAILYPGMSVIIVEGGRKAIKKYSRLLLNRVDWTANPRPRNEKDRENMPFTEEVIENECIQVWEGIVQKPSFTGFRIHKATSAPLARQHLKERRIEHYWDLAKNYIKPA